MTTEVTNAAQNLLEEEHERQMAGALTQEAILDRYIVFLLGKLKERIESVGIHKDFHDSTTMDYLAGCSQVTFITDNQPLFQRLLNLMLVGSVEGYKGILKQLDLYTQKAIESATREALSKTGSQETLVVVVHEGVLVKPDGAIIGAPQADEIARANDFTCAERLVDAWPGFALTLDKDYKITSREKYNETSIKISR